MKKHKTNKTVAKRIKITKNGKVQRRTMGKSHCLAKKNSNQIRRKQETRGIADVGKKIVRKYL